MRQAKLSITADIRGFKQQVEQAKKAVDGLTKIKMSPEVANSFKKIFGEQLNTQIKNAEKAASGLEKRLNQISKGSIVDEKKLNKYIDDLNTVNKKLDEMKKKRKDLESIGSGKGPTPPPEPGEGGGGIGGFMGKIGGLGKALGLAMGAMAIYNRRLSMAQSRMPIRELGSQLGSESSTLGFTPEERRSRMLDMTRASGRNLGSAESTSLTDLSETVQRGFGISSEESAGAVGTARKANESGEKYLSSTIGAAVAAKLEGSRIGEFLQASSAALADMSQNGVGIDSASLNGFAGALSTLPFFKNDPNKAFAQLKGIAEGFKDGDRFQQSQAMLSIQQLSGGVDPATAKMRMEAGLFHNFSEEELSMMPKEMRKGMSVKGEDIVDNLVKNTLDSTKGMDHSSRVYEVQKMLNLPEGGASTALANRLVKGGSMKGAGMDLSELKAAATGTEMQKKIRDKANENMANSDGAMLKVNATIQQSFDKAVDGLTNSILELSKNIIELINKMGGREGASNIGGLAVGAATALAGAALMPNILKKGAGKLATGAMSLGRAGLAGAASLTGMGATLNAGVGTLAAGGAAGLGTLAAGVGAAGLAGYGAGKYIINPALEKIGVEKNRYGQKSSAMDRGFGKMMTFMPKALGGIDDDQYDSMYGTEGEDKMLKNIEYEQQKKIDAAKSANPDLAILDNNTGATDQNTQALQMLTAAISMLKMGGGGPGMGQPMIGSGMKIGAS